MQNAPAFSGEVMVTGIGRLLAAFAISGNQPMQNRQVCTSVKPTAKMKQLQTAAGTEGLDYYLMPDGTYAVSGGTTEYLNEILIPSTYNGKLVSTIHKGGFSGYTALNKVTLPATITTIEADAFKGCTRLIDIICYAEDVPIASNSSFVNYNG